jgi:hypothetical protein
MRQAYTRMAVTLRTAKLRIACHPRRPVLADWSRPIYPLAGSRLARMSRYSPAEPGTPIPQPRLASAQNDTSRHYLIQFSQINRMHELTPNPLVLYRPGIAPVEHRPREAGSDQVTNSRDPRNHTASPGLPAGGAPSGKFASMPMLALQGGYGRHRPNWHAGPLTGHTRMGARLGGARQAGTRTPARPVRGRPWERRRCSPTVLTARTPVRYTSVDAATQRSAARQGDTRRDSAKRPA